MENLESEYTRDINFGGYWEESWKSHFKSQLLLFEIKGTCSKILYDGGGWGHRHAIMKSVVREAVYRRPSSKTRRFYLFTGDQLPMGVGTEWRLLSTTGTKKDLDAVIPDAYSFAWPEIGIADFMQYNPEMVQYSDKVAKEGRVTNKAFWRGSLGQHQARKQFHDFVNSSSKFEVSDNTATSFKEMKEIGDYSVLVDLPGQGYSARLKHILLSGRPVIVYPRSHWDWVTLRIEPGIHYPLSLKSPEHLAIMCEAFLENADARSHYSAEAASVRDLLDRNVLIDAVSTSIHVCE